MRRMRINNSFSKSRTKQAVMGLKTLVCKKQLNPFGGLPRETLCALVYNLDIEFCSGGNIYS